MNIPLTPIRGLYRSSDLYGDKIGVVSGEKRFTYRDFVQRCEQLAAGLKSEGVARGERVAFLSFNNNQLLEGYYAAPLIHSVVMPLNVRLTPVELTEILNHSGATILIFENDFSPLVAAFRKACPCLRHYVAINDAASSEADLTYEELLSRDRIERPDVFSFDENENAELFYTSGSTGTPKGVLLSHRTLYLHALNVLSSWPSTDADVALHTIPLFHANGWGAAQICPMIGCKQVMVRRFEPSYVLSLIAQEKATTMNLVPVMANALLNCPDLGRFDTFSLREIGLGGAASSPELIKRMEQAFGCEVKVGYGLTETSPVVSTSRIKDGVTFADEEDRIFRMSMAGWPVIGTEVRVVDAHMRDVPRDMETVGEVIVRGDNVMEGYYGEPEATERVMSDGWFHTGDMAVWDCHTYIHIVDRKKDIIISGGENISSIEVEKAIFAHPAVLECAVVAAPDAKWGEIPAAIVVTKPGHTLSGEELLSFLERRLAKFKHPRVVQFAGEALPKTGTGKILKRELREAFWVGKDRRVQGS